MLDIPFIDGIKLRISIKKNNHLTMSNITSKTSGDSCRHLLTSLLIIVVAHALNESMYLKWTFDIIFLWPEFSTLLITMEWQCNINDKTDGHSLNMVSFYWILWCCRQAYKVLLSCGKCTELQDILLNCIDRIASDIVDDSRRRQRVWNIVKKRKKETYRPLLIKTKFISMH